MKRSMEPARGPAAQRAKRLASRRPAGERRLGGGGRGLAIARLQEARAGAWWASLSYVTVTGQGLPALGQAEREPGPS